MSLAQFTDQVNLLPGHAYIELQQSLADDGRFTRHYEWLFWRPLLGAIAFDFWQILLTYEGCSHNKQPWPSIAHLSDTLGQGDRYTITGRAATSTRPVQTGIADILVRHGICTHRTMGSGRDTRHYFLNVKQALPRLNDKQLHQLTKRKRREHTRYLGVLGLE